MRDFLSFASNVYVGYMYRECLKQKSNLHEQQNNQEMAFGPWIRASATTEKRR